MSDNCIFISARERENIDHFRDVLYRKSASSMFRNIPTTTFYIHLKNKYNFYP